MTSYIVEIPIRVRPEGNIDYHLERVFVDVKRIQVIADDEEQACAIVEGMLDRLPR